MEILVGVLIALLAIGLVAYPLFVARPADRIFASDGEVRQEVDRYRAAIKAQTLCDRCLTANSPGSAYCGECGRSL
ncbi:MAG TPA: hypothetical protein VFZ04_06885 [Longimicrobiales bacterium]